LAVPPNGRSHGHGWRGMGGREGHLVGGWPAALDLRGIWFSGKAALRAIRPCRSRPRGLGSGSMRGFFAPEGRERDEIHVHFPRRQGRMRP
jgi:hypothetical protein